MLSSSSFSARMKLPSCPVRPTALPPKRLMRLTMSLLTLPSTISTTSMVSSSVTRMPWMNSPFLPTFCSRSLICGPPPCTTTGFMPTSLSSTTSRAKPSCNLGSVMALPPYLMTMVLSKKRWIYGSASDSVWAFCAAEATVNGMVLSFKILRAFYRIQKRNGRHVAAR